MLARLLGSICLAGAALPIAIHLRFAVIEMWSFALLIGVGVYLVGLAVGEQAAGSFDMKPASSQSTDMQGGRSPPVEQYVCGPARPSCP